MKMQYRPQLLIFDLDGTLAHTLPQLALAAQAVARALNIPVPDNETVSNFVGNGVTMLLARTIAGRKDVDLAQIPTELQQQARELFNKFYTAGLGENFMVYPGVAEGLARFKKLGILCAVATNKPETFARPLLGHMQLASSLDFILGGEVLPVRKPDPEPLFYVCRNLGVDPACALMVGDSVNDIQAGQNAGMPTAAFTYGYNGGHDVREFAPDYVFDHFPELSALIEELPAR